MTTDRDEPANVEEMLLTMDARIRTPENASQRSLGMIAQARERLSHFRREPVGGRLVRLKRMIFWFTASAFDRQAKVQEAVLDALTEIERELLDIRNRMMVDTGEPGPAPEPERAGRTR